MIRPILCLALPLTLLAACADTDAPIPNNATEGPAPRVEAIDDTDSRPGNLAAATPNAVPTDQWLGRWTGPEGLFLDIQSSSDGKPGHYALTNQDTLDRQDDYQGIADGTTIRFVRDGEDRTIRPGTGAETGFKYLADKTDCLIVVPGKEGYCR